MKRTLLHILDSNLNIVSYSGEKMKNSIILIMIIAAFLINDISYSKPTEPQVKGGFRSFTLTDYRYDSGKKKPKSIEKIATNIIDEHGNIIEEISYNNDSISLRLKIEYKYNDKDLIAESKYFDTKGKLFNRVTFVYDDKTNIINNVTYNTEGEVTEKGTYKYDENNFLIEESHDVRIDKNEFISGTTFFKNDKYGNKIEEKSVQKDGSSSTVTYEYKYDEQNNIIKMIRTSFDDFKFIKEYKYDKFGNVTEELYPDEKGFIILRKVYEYFK